MKLVIAILRDTDEGPVVERLTDRGFRVTRVASTGGFLRRGNATLLIGTQEDQVQPMLDLIRETCAAPEINQYRATVFVVNASHFEQI